MLMGVAGYVEFSSNVSWATVRVFYSETYDPVQNSSDVTVTDVKVRSTKWNRVTYYPDGVIQINGVTVATMDSWDGTHSVYPAVLGEWYSIVESGTKDLVSGTLKGILHNNDGSKSISISLDKNDYANFSFATISGDSGSGWSVSGSKQIDLTHIPRASDIGATDANIESISSIVVTKKSPSYTHTIRYEFGELAGYLTSNGGTSSVETKLSETSIAFMIPSEFYAQIPNTQTGKCKLTCTTYSEEGKIGDPKTVEFTVTAAESLCRPQVSGSVFDTNEVTIALTGDSSKLIKYFSDALCIITASEQKGASSIRSKTIGGVEVENARLISAIEAGSVRFVATDSRGYSTAVTVERPLVEYIKLTVNAQLNRTNPTNGEAVLTARGNYFNGSFGAANNEISAWYRLAKSGEEYGEWVQVTPVKTGSSYAIQVVLSGLDYLYSYSAQVRCEDKLISKTVTVVVSQGIPVVDWGQWDFRFNVPFLIPATMYGSTLPSGGKRGQVFFLQQSDGSYSIKIHDGISW